MNAKSFTAIIGNADVSGRASRRRQSLFDSVFQNRIPIVNPARPERHWHKIDDNTDVIAEPAADSFALCKRLAFVPQLCFPLNALKTVFPQESVGLGNELCYGMPNKEEFTDLLKEYKRLKDAGLLK